MVRLPEKVRRAATSRSSRPCVRDVTPTPRMAAFGSRGPVKGASESLLNNLTHTVIE
jgi:hypothetical protein